MILDEIIAHKKEVMKQKKQKKYSLREKLKQQDISIIAEIKKASPSKGLIANDFNPIKQLKAYQQADAAAVSVLTDQKYFQGSPQIFKEVRKNSQLPLLRKEFIIDKLQIYESCLLGADVILLIAAVLTKKELESYLKLSQKLGMEAIVEVHDLAELDKVKSLSEGLCQIIGVNNRDLKTFTVDIKNTAKIIKKLKKDNLRQNYKIISESGIKNSADMKYLHKLGVDGVLIGERLMKAKNPSKKLEELKQGINYDK